MTLALLAIVWLSPSGAHQRWCLAALLAAAVVVVVATRRRFRSLASQYLSAHGQDVARVAHVYVKASDSCVWVVRDPDDGHAVCGFVAAAAASNSAAPSHWLARILHAGLPPPRHPSDGNGVPPSAGARDLHVQRIVVVPRAADAVRRPRPSPTTAGAPGMMLLDALEASARGLGFRRVLLPVPAVANKALQQVCAVRGYTMDSLSEVSVASGLWSTETCVMALEL